MPGGAIEACIHALSFGETARLLSKILSAGDGRVLGGEVSAGEDLAFFAALWRFAGDAIVVGSILPAIECDRAVWQARLNAENQMRLDGFCANAPGLCRCLEDSLPPSAFFKYAVDGRLRVAGQTAFDPAPWSHSAGNLHTRFISALMGANSKIGWDDPQDVEKLARQLDSWKSKVSAQRAGIPQLGFRIVDPRSGWERPLWMLMPVIVAGDEITPLSAKTLAGLGRDEAFALLLELGKASLIAHDLAESPVSNPKLAAAALDGAALNAFMTDTVPQLAAEGYQVFAPRWWKPLAQRRIGIRARAVRGLPKLRAFSLDSLLDVQWEVVLDGTGLTERELRWIAENEGPIVKTGYGWMNYDRGLIVEARKTLEALSSKKTSVRDLVRIGLGLASSGKIDLEASPDVLPSGAKAIVEALVARGKIERVQVPKALSGELRQYQRAGLDWLSFLRKMGFGACLADDMGLGKTIETLAALLDARADGVKGPFLVICPMSIMLKWSHEAARFAPALKTWIYHGSRRQHGEDFLRMALSHDLCITSYHMAGQEFEAFSAVKWSVVALDEAQNIKNPETMKSRSARALDADWRIAITGTPIENSVSDLWAIMDFLNKGLLPSRDAFDSRYRYYGEQDGGALGHLRKIVAPFILRRLKNDPDIAAGLPDKVEEKVFCRLSAEQAKAYATAMEAAEGDISSKTGISRRGAVLGLITRLKEICDYPALDDAKEGLDPEKSGKLERLDDMLGKILAAGESSLVFTQYVGFGRRLAKHLSCRFGFEVPFLHGAVSAENRAKMVGDFQSENGPKILLISIRAGGTGFDLTRATHVFHYDRWWNPAVENQATDRTHRIGQTKTVFVHTFICDGTLESRIDELIAGKTALAENIISNGSGWLANLDDKQLREILALSKDEQSY